MEPVRESIDNSKVIDVIQNLIETCRDGQNGHRFAAEHATNPELKTFFNGQSLKRGQFAGELEQEIERLGKSDPDRDGTTKGSLHRAWFELKSKLGAGDDEGLLSWMEQGEDHAKKQYQEALQVKMPSNIIDVIDRQSIEVIAAHDQVRDMRDRLKKAA